MASKIKLNSIGKERINLFLSRCFNNFVNSDRVAWYKHAEDSFNALLSSAPKGATIIVTIAISSKYSISGYPENCCLTFEDFLGRAQ